MPSTASSKQHPPLRIPMSSGELRELREIVDYYQRSMGFMRHIIRATTLAPTRRRLRHIDDESKYLRLFIAAQQVRAPDGDECDVSFTPRAAMALWGRLLSSLNVSRSRRKLSEDTVACRERIAAKFEQAFAAYAVRRKATVESELATRRIREQAWMRVQLGWAPLETPE